MAPRKPSPRNPKVEERRPAPAPRPVPAPVSRPTPAPSRGGPPPAPRPTPKPPSGGKPMPGLPSLPTGPGKPKPTPGKSGGAPFTMDELAAAMPGYSGPTFTQPVDLTNVGASPAGWDFGGGGGGGGGEAPERDYMLEYYQGLEANRQRNAIATIKALLDQYGLNSLYNVIVGYVKDGYDADAAMALIRTTPEYKQRFPAMEALSKKGRAISEAVYIDYERGAASLEQRYGLPKGMLTGNVTKLLESEVSTSELNDRVALSSAASLQAPQDLKDTLANYYGIGQGGLTAYFLDPGIAMPLLEKQYATAQIGTEALRQDVGIDVGIASQLQELGVTQQQAREGFGEVSRQREFMTGRGETASRETLIKGNVAGDAEARKQIERIGSGRVARFQGGGGFVGEGQGSRSGLQQAST